ncbi:glycosyltransferase family 4 protein [Maribacter sp. X9]|uniref:glycosyltransferase family 4 protein n=1 Tax=Maribacter sp. X9 TaxID=3402159 RepID=UPI003AF3B05D
MKIDQSKKKIVIDARMINSSGIGVYLKNILPSIIDNFHVVLLGNKKELSNFPWSDKVSIIEFSAKIYSILEQILYPFVIPKTELVWFPHYNIPFFYTSSKKILTTIHDVNHLANKKDLSYIKWKYAKILITKAVRKSDRLITISEHSRKELIKFTKVKRDKISIISNGVDFKLFNTKVRQISKIKNIQNYILYVGNVKPHKNLITLLKAYQILPDQFKEKFKLVILGKKEGFITPDLEVFNFIEENKLLKHIIFTGYIKDEEVPSVYQSASLFVFPSIYEGFGLPVLEAMASGIPVLTSNSSSLPEVGGEAASYFEPMDHMQLSTKISEIILNEELKSVLIKKGYQQAKKFSWEPAQKKHVETIRLLLD